MPPKAAAKKLPPVEQWIPGQLGVDTRTGAWFIFHGIEEKIIAGQDLTLVQGRFLGNPDGTGTHLVAHGAHIAKLAPVANDTAEKALEALYTAVKKAKPVKVQGRALSTHLPGLEQRARVTDPAQLTGVLREIVGYMRARNENPNTSAGHSLDYFDLFERVAYTVAYWTQAVRGTPVQETYTQLSTLLRAPDGPARGKKAAKADGDTGDAGPSDTAEDGAEDGAEDSTPAAPPKPAPAPAAFTAYTPPPAADVDGEPDDTHLSWARALLGPAHGVAVADAYAELTPLRFVLYVTHLVPAHIRPSLARLTDMLGQETDALQRELRHAQRIMMPVAASSTPAAQPVRAPILPKPATPAVTPPTVTGSLRQQFSHRAGSGRTRNKPAAKPAPRPAAEPKPESPPVAHDFGWFTVNVHDRKQRARLVAGSDRALSGGAFGLLQHLHAAPGMFLDRDALGRALFPAMQNRDASLSGVTAELRRAFDGELAVRGQTGKATDILLVRNGRMRLLRPGETLEPESIPDPAPATRQSISKPTAERGVKPQQTQPRILGTEDFGDFKIHDLGAHKMALLEGAQGRRLISQVAVKIIRHAAGPALRGTWVSRAQIGQAVSPDDKCFVSNLRTVLPKIEAAFEQALGPEGRARVFRIENKHGITVAKQGQPCPDLPAPPKKPEPELRDFGPFSVTIQPTGRKDAATVTGTDVVVPRAVLALFDLLHARRGAWVSRASIGQTLFEGTDASRYVMAKRTIDAARAVLQKAMGDAAETTLYAANGHGVCFAAPGQTQPPAAPVAEKTRAPKPAASQPPVTHGFDNFSVTLQENSMKDAVVARGDTQVAVSNLGGRILLHLAAPERRGEWVSRRDLAMTIAPENKALSGYLPGVLARLNAALPGLSGDAPLLAFDADGRVQMAPVPPATPALDTAHSMDFGDFRIQYAPDSGKPAMIAGTDKGFSQTHYKVLRRLFNQRAEPVAARTLGAEIYPTHRHPEKTAYAAIFNIRATLRAAHVENADAIITTLPDKGGFQYTGPRAPKPRGRAPS